MKKKNPNYVLALLAVVVFSTVVFHSCKKSGNEAPVVTSDEALKRLPFGNSKILRRDLGVTQPARESLWLCGVPPNGRGNTNASDWTNADGTWDFTKKPTVQGNVMWPSVFSATLDGLGNRIISGNGLPSTPTGVFPTEPNTLAYRYDPNPSHIEAHVINYTFKAIPQEAASPSCLPYGPAGISLTGAYIYHGASTLPNDASAYEILDASGGQSDGTFSYHYHFLSNNLLNKLDPAGSGHSAIMGYMLDGFGIYGPRGEDGKILTSKDLDECHGHKHPVLWDGSMVNIYHYHWTYDFPYNIGAFKGTR